jgi:hypothetical protein
MIKLTYGGQFDEKELVAYIRASDCKYYIVQGQQKVSRKSHTKPNSLDFWLRPFGKCPDTKQADNDVCEALVATGLFRISYGLKCPDTGRFVKGLVLVESDDI